MTGVQTCALPICQIRATLAWTLRHIGDYGGDPGRVAVGGHSAGGQLTAMALQTDWQRDYGLPADPFRAGLLISGIYDISPLRYSYLQPLIQLDDGLVQRNSPLFSVRPCPTPIWTTWGALESSEFDRQARTFHAAWEAIGNQGELRAVPQTDHFSVIHGLESPTSDMSQWLARHLDT